MIRVPQAGVAQPAIFDEGGAGPLETERALRHFTAAQTDGQFEFEVYGHKTVREALTLLFRGKCAYCESRFDATQPVDVEHWRPKADVEEDVTQTDARGRTRTVRRKLGRGYYWLAARWENLLPSCIDCNRVRTHRILPTGEERAIGKGNLFPLDASCVRATCQGEEANEVPLLLNPYLDDPTELLELGDEGELQPRNTQGGAPDPRAIASIQVYALNRPGLVLARRQLLYEMEQHMHVIRQLVQVLTEPLRPEVEDLILDLIDYETRALHAFADPERPYSLCAARALHRFEEEMGLPSRT